jgi:hypothetical protein
MPITINGSGTVTGITGITGTNATLAGITSVASNAVDTPVILQDSSSNSATCRAWVNFNGTGTPSIRADFNVSSITDNGTGDYTINFTTAMPDANYSVSGSTGGTGAAFCWRTIEDVTARTASAFRISTLNISNLQVIDPAQVNLAVFR